MIRIGIVGCGAVTEHLHLPALREVPEAGVAALVDIREDRARRSAASYNVPAWSTDYRDLIGKVDAALITLPNAFHSTVAVNLLEKRIHVLCEKPMALNTAECDEMIAAADRAQVVLAIGLVRRFYPSMRAVKRLLDCGCLGEIERFDFQEGAPYSWPASTGAPFRKSAAGGGVLMDIGAHTLDLLLWWLGEWAEVEYADDNFAGLEANCHLSLRLSSGAVGTVRLSRSHHLSNTLRINGSRGWVEVEPHSFTALRCYLPDVLGPYPVELNITSDRAAGPSEQSGLLTYVAEEHLDFLQAIHGRGGPFVSGIEGRRSVALIEECYSQGRRLSMPWMAYEPIIGPIA